MSPTSYLAIAALLLFTAPEALADGGQHAYAPLKKGALRTFRVRTRTADGKFRSATIQRRVTATGRTPQGDLAATVQQSFVAGRGKARRVSSTMHTEVVGKHGMYGALAARPASQVRLVDAQRRNVVLPHGLKPGMTWTEVNPRGAGVLTASKVVHKVEGFASVKINGRKVNALKISSVETFARGGQPFRTTSYHAKDLGVVKYVYRDQTGAVTVAKLRSYSLGLQ